MKDAPDILFVTKDRKYAAGNMQYGDAIISEEYGRKGMGVHDINGLFIAGGPNIKKTNVNGKVFDLTPTLLSYFGIPKDPDIDGKVLDIFTTCIKAQKPVN